MQNSRVTGGDGPKKKVRQDSPQQRAKDAFKDVLSVLDVKEIKQLPKNAQAQAKSELKNFQTLLGKGKLPDSAIESAIASIREKLTEDLSSGSEIADYKPTGAALKLPAGFDKGDPYVRDNALHPALASKAHGLGYVLDKLGFNPSALDPEIAEMLGDMLGKESGQISAKSFKKIEKELLHRSPKKDEILAKSGADTSAASTKARPKKPTLTQSTPIGGSPVTDDGSRLATGMPEELSQLLEHHGFDPDNLDANAADALAGILSGKTFNAASFAKLDRALTSAAQKAEKVQAQTAQDATPEAPMSDEGSVRNPGLEATASAEFGEGNRANSIALLAGNLRSFTSKDNNDPKVTKALTQVTDAIASELHAEKPLTKAEAKAIKKALKKVLVQDSKVPSHEGSQVRTSDVAANAFRELSKNNPDSDSTRLAAAYLGGLNQLIVGGKTEDADYVLRRPTAEEKAAEPNRKCLADSIDEISAQGLYDLASQTIGRDVKEPSQGLLKKIMYMTGNLGPAELGERVEEDLAQVDPKSATGKFAQKMKAKSAEAAQKVGDVPSEVLEDAKNELRAMQEAMPDGMAFKHLDLDSPQGKMAVAAVAGALQKSENPAEFIHNCLGEVQNRVGFMPPHLGFHGQRANNLAHEINKADQSIAHLEGTDLPDKADRIASWQQLKSEASEELGHLKYLTMSDLAMASANPEGYAEHHRLAAQQAGGQNGPVNLWDVNTKQFGVAGVTGTGNPRDKGEKADLYARRSMVIGSILNDPSLCIEDKIFLFMMWFAAFSDEERIGKMEELAELDRQDADRHERLKAEKANVADTKQQRNAASAEYQALQKEVTALKSSDSPDADALAQKEEKLATLGTRVQDLTQRADAQEQAVSALETELQEAPKSREILLFELDRITQLRASIMEMARHFLDDAHRRIEKIMR